MYKYTNFKRFILLFSKSVQMIFNFGCIYFVNIFIKLSEKILSFCDNDTQITKEAAIIKVQDNNL